MFSIKQIKADAKNAMAGNYGYALLGMILLALVMLGGGIALGLGAIVVGGAVTACRTIMYLNVAKGQFKGVDSLYDGFKHFWRAFKLMLWQLLFGFVFFVAFSILFLLLGKISVFVSVIGGNIILAIYSLAFACTAAYLLIKFSFSRFFIVDRPELTALQCVKESFKLTKKRFFKLLGYHLSFILWWLGCLFTLGLLNLRYAPYKATADAYVYLSLQIKDSKRG